MIDVLSNKKCFRHSIDKIQIKIIESEPIKSTKFLYHVLYTQNNTYDGLALGYQS